MKKKEVLVVAAVTTAAVVVGAAVLVRQWKRRSERRWRHAQRILRKFARECATPVPKLWDVANDLVADMQAGLASNQSKLAMLPIHLGGSLPTGNEKGLHYGINLKADNFLILRAQLGGKDEPLTQLHREEIKLPSNFTHGSSKELFDFIALELSKFLSATTESSEARSRNGVLGFVVSLPMDQLASSTCKGIDWKRLKSDTVESVINNISCREIGSGFSSRTELVDEVNQALEKHSVKMRVLALVDDVVGDLAGGRYHSKECVAAVTFGMATNVAYTESPLEVHNSHNESPKSEELVINMGWGNFSSSNLPITEYDTSLDAESTNPGGMVFEKLTSGMYLGEIVRKVLLKMALETALFGEQLPPKLKIPYLLRPPEMAAMHQDASEDYTVVNEKLKQIFEIEDTTPMVREIVTEICDVVAERGARLVGAGIVGIVKKLGRTANKKSVIIAEGGQYEHYRVFRNYLHSTIWEMLGGDLSDNVSIEHSHGGTGAGALFLAASQTQDTDSSLSSPSNGSIGDHGIAVDK